jgi:hypothetical protein
VSAGLPSSFCLLHFCFILRHAVEVICGKMKIGSGYFSLLIYAGFFLNSAIGDSGPS